MYIIIEGLHDTGKSTLVQKLIEMYHFSQFESKRLFPEFASARISNVTDFAFGTNCSIVWMTKMFCKSNVLFDRLHVSEYAYSQAFNRIDQKQAMQRFKVVDENLSKYDVGLIYLHCDYKHVLSRKKDKNNVYNEQDYYELKRHFDEIYKQTKIKTINIDTGVNDASAVFDISTMFLEELQRGFDEKI